MHSHSKTERIQLLIVLTACMVITMLYLSHRPKDEVQFVSSVVESKKMKTTRHVSNPIDFEAYKTVNPDVYAYLYIDQSGIDYPILQRQNDDAYYLSHSYDGRSSTSGSIYTEAINTKDFHDPNTVIYGHNVMDYGTMFHELLQYQHPDYFRKHHLIYIYTEQGIYQYQVFAAYFYDDRHLLYSFDFNDPNVYQAFLDDVFDRTDGVINSSVPVDSTNSIITLSTCKDLGDERFLVHAVLKQYIPCPAQTSTAVEQDMKAMKEPQVIAARPAANRERKKMVKKPTWKQELRAAFPYLLVMAVLVMCYTGMRIRDRMQNKMFPLISSLKVNIRRQIHFIGFLVQAGMKELLEKLKFLWFLRGQLAKTVCEKVRFLCFLIKQLIKELLTILFHRS